ncbi:MAG: branched-chain amino acid ABC transporter permease [Evtepia sp.]|nr:branched-chain amino acid ABC transporter permease [Evtepia sp.]
MYINFTAQTIITAGAVVGAAVALVSFFAKLVRWADRQKAQDKELQDVKAELTLLTYGVLACLKGLKEHGCNGPVTEAVNKIEKHINQKAHDQGGN